MVSGKILFLFFHKPQRFRSPVKQYLKECQYLSITFGTVVTGRCPINCSAKDIAFECLFKENILWCQRVGNVPKIGETMAEIPGT